MNGYKIEDLVEADCRLCHSSGVPDRHHLQYGQPIPPGSLVPFPDADNDGNPDTVYACLNCHDENFTVVRDCVTCHTMIAHHSTPMATSGDCQYCHGDLVDNIGDGHYIPTYEPSLVTPSPSDGTGLPVNSRGHGAGACDYCHDDDNLEPEIILGNQDLHHGASSRCYWCHDFGASDEYDIRTCEGCHGPDSLHTIQADSPNGANVGTLVVGGEDAGYGHVGRDAGPNDSDCWGCHGFEFATVKSGLAPGFGPIVPTIYYADVAVIGAGESTLVTITGSGFTNVAGGAWYQSTVALTAADGSWVTLIPELIDEGSLAVTIPGDTAAGNYSLQALKTDAGDFKVASNPVVISVVPEVTITDTSATSDGIVTINGSGFGGFADGSGTSVMGRVTTGKGVARTTATVEGTILRWTDTTIAVGFAESSHEVTVNSVFGTDTLRVGHVERGKGTGKGRGKGRGQN